MSHIPGHGVIQFTAPIGPTPSGAPLPSTSLIPTGGGGDDFNAFMEQWAAFLASQAGGGGGFAPPAFSGTEAGLRLSGQLGLDQMRLGGQLNITEIQERARLEESIGIRLEELRQKGALSLQERNEIFALEQQQKQFQQDRDILAQQEGIGRRLEELRQKGALTLQESQQKFQLEQQLKALEQERSITIAQTMGTNPVRALLMQLGIGGSLVPGGEKFVGLGPLQGAEQARTETVSALEGLTGRTGISIGAQGVSGLGTVEQQARTFQRGTGAGNILLSDAFGVGDVATGGGLSTQEIQRRVQDVTPTGTLR